METQRLDRGGHLISVESLSELFAVLKLTLNRTGYVSLVDLDDVVGSSYWSLNG